MSQQGHDPSWICIHFEKYSYNTSRIGARKYDWTHVGPRTDLSLVIRDVRVAEVGTCNIKTMMQVTAGSEILETQDLRELVEHHRNHISLPESDRPVRVVIRAPVWLAMVFPKTNTTVQRVQFKFNHQSDFKKVVAIFSELGLPTRDSPLPRTTANSKPPRSLSPTPSVLSSITPQSTILTAPSTVSNSSTLYRCSNLNDNVFNPQTMPQIKEPKLSNFPSTAKLQPSGMLPHSINYMPAHDMSTTMTPLELATRSSFPHRYSTQEISKQTSVFSSQIDSEPLDCGNSTALLPSQSSALELSGPTLAYKAIHPLQGEAFEKDANLRLCTTSPFFTQIDKPQQSQRFCKELSSPETRLQTIIGLDTLSSDNIEKTDPQAPNIDASRSLWIPPKRELPFLKSQATQRSRSLSVFDLPPLPKPGHSTRSGSVLHSAPNRGQEPSNPVATSVKRRIADRKAPLSMDTDKIPQGKEACPELIPHEAASDSGPMTSLEQESPLAVKIAAARLPASAKSNLQSKATSRKRAALVRPTSVSKRVKMIDQGTQTHTISNSDPVAMNADKEANVPQLVPGGSSVISPPDDFLNDLDDFISAHKNRPPPKELWDTPGYASLDAEERKRSINNFICDNLDDANFLQLCKDVEFAWRKIGLGLQ